MKIELLRQYLDEPTMAKPWLDEALRLRQTNTGHGNLRRMAESGVTLDLLADLCQQFSDVAPNLADADMAWNNLERFIVASRNPMATCALFERDREALPRLLTMFSTSQYLSDLLIVDSGAYDLLRMTEGQPVAREVLVEELVGEILSVEQPTEAMRILRTFKRRETLRIAYGDIVREQPIPTIARQISFVADAAVEAAQRFARRALEERMGVPMFQGRPAGFVVLALGKLGGLELNYSSDIDLILISEGDGNTDGRRQVTNQEFFERLTRDMVKLLTEPTDLGTTYRVDLRLRPEGSRGTACITYDRARAYYDIKGRTWERQAMIKARPIAGDIELGKRLLSELEPWIYHRYLSLADITGIKTLKRQIETRTRQHGTHEIDVKTGVGGIRDIEFAIQFLQMLNGGTLPEVRTGNTLEGIANLEEAKCLRIQERTLLEENYCLLRKLEHRLQILYDLQTHTLPENPDELRKLAIRMGYRPSLERSALAAFEEDFRERKEINRKILNHLLHDAFGEDAHLEPEIDLVNNPAPLPEEIDAVLGKYKFQDTQGAYRNLMALATEKIRFLSTRRCRHFLASIAPKLLQAIAATPDPDATLVNLSQVSDSLGGKAALWELFRSNRPSLDLYVKLCAACPYLSSILTSNPGMIDELMDSLLVDSLPTPEMLEATLAELTRGAEDVDPILHSFKHAQHLRVGVRDILNKDHVENTQAALSDVAEVCLRNIADREAEKLCSKFGTPTIPSFANDTEVSDELRERFANREGEECGLVILALGKLGGHEPNYHSDLDVVFLYEAEGRTFHTARSGEKISSSATTSNNHYFSDLGQRIITHASRIGPFGRLYEVDARLRPTGKSGSLAVPIDGFLKYFESGSADLWERQALCKARVIYGTPVASAYAMRAVHQAAFGKPWTAENTDKIREMRSRMEETATPRNLKRGRGGTVDTEFLVQMLQLKHGGDDASIRVPGTLQALTALEQQGYLAADDAEFFRESYRFQRSVEARIRLMNSTGRHEIPSDEHDLAKLAYLLDYADLNALQQRVAEMFDATRERFEKLFAAERG
ncbi:bifunctional [glutamate--ammonia ligase]-adenylyl-L-tyrosine phosphorylase/[glutamate--ammonia-ligase] adenylyltransferase [Aeoliella mucimassa]|uniref:Glutamate-ammonia-ligase adenylyltransferase n=1 Tax=Aeoliella mucimassa TaxID=2527972 RepID=A0A518AID3_9BACT|nr:bifunctional [glutamate--ammonia ligase]-adenylyl-L-tyrosine phosphorylase/[glutamate--ammonia-ligase] adenylyltransferase [Aeoliella mucimassa]QDU54476.1 Glutamate-ammonia-ligase adenylyltransferase [Aeoliella mucimassa]